MHFRSGSKHRPQSLRLWVATLALLSAAALLLVNCGGSTEVSGQFNPPRGTVSVSLSDPPSCRVPNGDLKHVYVTIRSVQAHISSTAGDNSGGWEELAPQLTSQPMQIDLLATPTGGCALAQLGSNTSIPAGSYQQIRLLLVSNTPASGDPVPTNNACGGQGFNCLVLSDDSVHRLELASQANTGLKIPPGQIVGGPIRVDNGQHVDLNIDFNACASIVLQGNGQYRLKPTLTAGQVSSATNGLSGQVVDSATMQPIAGGTVLVAIEQPDGDGVDRVVMQTAADANGNFTFCPLPMGTFDVVGVAIDGNGVAYNATVLLNATAGASLGKIPLVAETGMDTGPATIEGTVTATAGAAGASVDVAMSALQAVTLSGGATRQVSIPLQGASTVNVATAAGMSCPMNTNCANYTLIVPASNPSVGTFSTSGTTFAAPAAGDVLFSVEGRSFAPMSGGTPICSPARQTTDKDSLDMPLKVTAGATVTAKRLDFTGCM
jgi:hypothetical protein